MDAAIALGVVPVIVGLVVLTLRLGLPPFYETPAAIVLGVATSLGDTLAGRLPGGILVADALLRGVAVGLTSDGLIATIRRLTVERGPGRR